MSYWKSMILTAAALVGVMAVFELSNFDLWSQDHFYDFLNQRWFLAKENMLVRIPLYTGIKVVIIAVGVVCGVSFLLTYHKTWGKRLRPARRGLAIMTLSLIFVPLILSTAREFTNVYTPRQVERYGGKYPYVKTLARYPESFHQEKKGKGFPAAHASAGLALMGMYFAFRRKAWRISGLIAGFVIGWVMGCYQMVIGQHYLSHTIVSTLVAWMILLTINRLVPPDRQIDT